MQVGGEISPVSPGLELEQPINSIRALWNLLRARPDNQHVLWRHTPINVRHEPRVVEPAGLAQEAAPALVEQVIGAPPCVRARRPLLEHLVWQLIQKLRTTENACCVRHGRFDHKTLGCL